ncbi:MAG: hypothetical protein ABWZ76_07235 [Acidimicrobiales bacterium]
MVRMTGGRMVSTVLLAGVALLVWAATWAMDSASYGTVVGVFVGGLLALAALGMGRWTAGREPDARVARLLLVAPLVKLAMAIPRYAVTFVVYDGTADAASYHDEGIRLQEWYAQGVFDADLGRPFVGTGFIRMLTGLLYSVTGPSLLGAFFVFSFVGYVGLYLFYRAFCIAVPEGQRHRYAVLVLLLPSLLFWPSSLGKEAWMTLGLGILAYGSARLLTSQRHGFPLVLTGLMAAGAVRPHVAAIGAIALSVAYLTRRRPPQASVLAPVGKLVGLLILGVVLVVAVGQAQTVLGIDDFDREAVQTARETVTVRTDQGGSAFENEQTDFDPSQFHNAVLNVLFRPFPWEAGNVQALIASLEGMVLLALFVFGWRRLLGAVRAVLRTPYIVLCITYSVLFIYGFSSFTNFGILTRQRVQVLPFVLVLICLPPFKADQRRLRALLVEPEDVGRHVAVR